MAHHTVTIKDIAKKLGISKSTVSRALRDHPNVKEETKKAVTALAAALDYHPDPVARGLLNKKTYILGVIVPNLSFPYFSLAVSGMQEIASKAGYQIMICQSNESYETEKAVIRTLTANRVDGLILSISIETREDAHIRELIRKKVPLVLFDRVIGDIPVPSVVMDNTDAAFRMTEHLIEQGYRRIAHIAGPESLLVSKQRVKGYTLALRKYGLPIDPELLIYKGFRIESGKEAAEALLGLPQPPDAIMAVSDSAAAGAIMAIESRGMRVPDDIAVSGFNNEVYTSFVKPPVTTVSLPMYDLGKEAIRLLLRQISHSEEPVSFEPRVLKSSLVIRESTRRKADTQ
ncbi:MAG: LacI family DNA-binding transcriptional regulator [Bacteroidia bacterium]